MANTIGDFESPGWKAKKQHLRTKLLQTNWNVQYLYFTFHEYCLVKRCGSGKDISRLLKWVKASSMPLLLFCLSCWGVGWKWPTHPSTHPLTSKSVLNNPYNALHPLQVGGEGNNINMAWHVPVSCWQGHGSQHLPTKLNLIHMIMTKHVWSCFVQQRKELVKGIVHRFKHWRRSWACQQGWNASHISRARLLISCPMANIIDDFETELQCTTPLLYTSCRL